MIDVIIIGGGVIGCAIAQNLSKYKLNIIVLEKGIEVCQGTSKANSAIIHAGYDAPEGSLKSKLNIMGAKMFPSLSEKLGFIYIKSGSLVLAYNEDDIKQINELYERGVKNGVDGLELISGEKARELEPELSNEVVSALYCDSAGIIDPFGFTYALIENAIENGTELITQTEVLGIEKGNKIKVITNKDEYLADIVINAAGVNSGAVQNMAGDSEFKIQPTKGVYRLLDSDTKTKVSRVIFQTPTKKGKGILVIPTYHGNLMLGPTAEYTEDGADTSVSEESLDMVDALARKSVPNIDIKSSIRVFTGVRAKPDTGDFMIFNSKVIPGVYHVGGIESPGLASSPAIAEYVKDMIKKDFVLEKKKVFKDTRPSPVQLKNLSIEEKNDLIKDNPDYGEIICRCENVSKGEIIKAINRPAGAVTIDGVKRRARAGMGRCQGGFCGPKVIEILSTELRIRPDQVLKEHAKSEMIIGYLKEEHNERI